MSRENTSRQINFKRLNNTRDLGGIITADGRKIKEGLLYRSGHLFFSDPEDIEKLNKLNIRKIYDFRSVQERLEKPDPVLDMADNVHIPIVRDLTAGMTREEKADQQASDMIIYNIKKDPGFGTRYMTDTYLKLVSDDYAREQYSRFINDITETTDGAVLWHCTAGKDRAGFGTVLLLEILGVARDDIFDDYLLTNTFIADEINMVIDMLDEKMGLANAEEPVRSFFGAREEYLSITYKYVQDNFGGMDEFIKDGLRISDAKKQILKNRYLTD